MSDEPRGTIMATVVDWTKTAAVEIMGLPRMEITTDQVAEVIAKHCPFKPNVAYRPVDPITDGRWVLSLEHCEICAPQEKRLEQHRCAAHIGTRP